MNTRQAFRDVFRPVLTEHGFRYNGKVFCRLSGEFLQGIVVVPASGGGYFFRFACYPYWMHNLIYYEDSMYNDFQKPWWVEQYDAPGTYAYFNKNDLEKSLEDMREYLKLIEEQLLPHLDAIDDLESLQTAIGQDVLFTNWVNQYVMLYIARENPSFALSYIEREKESYYASRRYYFPNMTDETIQADWERSREHNFGKVLKAIETNDFDSILSPHWENRAALKARIEKELKLDVSHLL